MEVRDAAVLTLDSSYVYDGVRLDLDALFRLHPMFLEVVSRLESVGERVQEMLRMLAGSAAPDIAPDSHCFEPYPCPYYAHCNP